MPQAPDYIEKHISKVRIIIPGKRAPAIMPDFKAEFSSSRAVVAGPFGFENGFVNPEYQVDNMHTGDSFRVGVHDELIKHEILADALIEKSGDKREITVFVY